MEEASERREDRDRGGRFGSEFRDNDEAPSASKRREEKEFKFDSDRSIESKPKSASTKPIKKIDLGAAAFYKGDPALVRKMSQGSEWNG